jgi:hypothetical protein
MSQRAVGVSKIVAIIGGVFFALAGLMAMAAPETFFDSVATFDPYNQHFIQDLGAFQIGLGAVLLIAVFARGDAITAALLGVGVGAVAHTISHIFGTDLGGKPASDIPMFAILSVVLLAAGIGRLRALR